MASYGCELWWNANPEANIQGYYVYCGQVSGIYDDASSPRWVGNVLHTAYIVPSAGTWYFAVAAKDTNGNVGGLSQEMAITASYANWVPVGVPVLSLR